MSLTYQPFAELPEIEKLSHDLYRNVADTERMVSGLAGASLLTLGLGGSGWARWLLLGAGAALVHRAATGHCAWYAHENINKRREAEAAAENKNAHPRSDIKIEESVPLPA